MALETTIREDRQDLLPIAYVGFLGGRKARENGNAGEYQDKGDWPRNSAHYFRPTTDAPPMKRTSEASLSLA